MRMLMYLDAYGPRFVFFAASATTNVRGRLTYLDACARLGVCVVCVSFGVFATMDVCGNVDVSRSV